MFQYAFHLNSNYDKEIGSMNNQITETLSNNYANYI